MFSFRSCPPLTTTQPSTNSARRGHPNPRPAPPGPRPQAHRLRPPARRHVPAAGPDTAPAVHPRAFGTSDIGQILAGILRGLHRAQELEARVVRTAARLDAGPAPIPASAPRNPRATPATPPDTGPTQIPTLEQITAEVRRRPIGAVIADICRDLGILPSHPLWRELSIAIIRYGGSLATLVNDLLDRLFRQDPAAAAVPDRPALAAPLVAPATGPP